MATEQEVAATQKLSAELDAKVKQLVQQAQDPSKNLAPLFDGLDKEVDRFVGLNRRKDQPAGMPQDCFIAALDVVGDWADLEGEAVKAISEAEGGGKTPGSQPSRSAPRRGMRI